MSRPCYGWFTESFLRSCPSLGSPKPSRDKNRCMARRENISPSCLEWSWPVSTHLYAFLRYKAGGGQGSLEARWLQGGEQSEALLRRTEPVGSPKGDSVEDRVVMGSCSSSPWLSSAAALSPGFGNVTGCHSFPWMAALKRDWEAFWSLERVPNGILSFYSHIPGEHLSPYFVSGETESGENSVILSMGMEELKFEFGSVWIQSTRTKLLFHSKLCYTWQEK